MFRENEIWSHQCNGHRDVGHRISSLVGYTDRMLC
jgi:hypothetical protein